MKWGKLESNQQGLSSALFYMVHLPRLLFPQSAGTLPRHKKRSYATLAGLKATIV